MTAAIIGIISPLIVLGLIFTGTAAVERLRLSSTGAVAIGMMFGMGFVMALLLCSGDGA